jgi:hypothetical protein
MIHSGSAISENINEFSNDYLVKDDDKNNSIVTNFTFGRITSKFLKLHLLPTVSSFSFIN